MSKTCMIYHSRDLDGWMSAAIVKKWFEENRNYCRISDYGKVVETDLDTNHKIDTLEFLGWDYEDEIPDLSEYDKVIMCDVSFPKESMENIGLDSDEFIWIDHHKSAIEIIETDIVINLKEEWIVHILGLRDTNFAACELTWKYFFPNETMPEIVRLLGRYDYFSYKETDEEQKVLEFQYGARQVINSYEKAYTYLVANCHDSQSSVIEMIKSDGAVIYKYLCIEAKQIYNKAFVIRLENLDILIEGVSKVYKFLTVNHERFNPINFGIDYHKEGYDGFACFWYKDGKWMWSLYNDDGNVDCSMIAKQYGGGGHKGAAGFIIEDLTQII